MYELQQLCTGLCLAWAVDASPRKVPSWAWAAKVPTNLCPGLHESVANAVGCLSVSRAALGKSALVYSHCFEMGIDLVAIEDIEALSETPPAEFAYRLAQAGMELTAAYLQLPQGQRTKAVGWSASHSLSKATVPCGRLFGALWLCARHPDDVRRAARSASDNQGHSGCRVTWLRRNASQRQKAFAQLALNLPVGCATLLCTGG